MRLNRRDDNESGIVEFWRALGCLWIPQPRESGFDGVLVARTGVHIVEIKNPDRRWTLTDAEQQRQLEVELAGGVYNIVCTDEDARVLVGL